MLKKLLILTTLGMTLSGCYMVPMALIGPATSGFTTASLMQAGASTTANYLVKKSTGKTVSEHVFDSVSKEVLQQSYLPNNHKNKKTIIYSPF